MKVNRLMILLVTSAVMGISCGQRPQPVESGSDNAKLRPEVAAARAGATPSPTFGDARPVEPNPSP